MTTAVNTFVRQRLREESIPFQVKPYDDYKAKLNQSLQQANDGKLISLSLDELESLEDTNTDTTLEFLKTRRKESGL